MSIPELRLAVSLTGLALPAPGAGMADGVRAAIRWAGDSGFRGVAIDASTPGLRARDLDRSARRDLAATLRRAGIASAGVDLFLPPEHLDDARRADRAIAALTGALALAAELAALTDGQPVVSVVLPPVASDEPAWRAPVVHEAQRVGTRIADCAWPASGAADAVGPIGIGIDAAAVAASGADPSAAVSRAGAALSSVRVSDWDGISRVPVGRGRLDELAFPLPGAQPHIPLGLDVLL